MCQVVTLRLYVIVVVKFDDGSDFEKSIVVMKVLLDNINIYSR